MAPLPLRTLYSVGEWLEENSNGVIKETTMGLKPGEVPNVLSLVTKIIMRVDVSKLIMDILALPTNPETLKPLNELPNKEFFDKFLDITTAHQVYKVFSELNDLEALIKNLQSLPMVSKLMEISSLTFGIPYSNILRQNTGSRQSKLEGSHSHKSIGTSEPEDTGSQVPGRTPYPTKTFNTVQ
jgi:hypothetical protein